MSPSVPESGSCTTKAPLKEAEADARRIAVDSSPMSNLLPAERSSLEQLFGMAGGYVLDFSDTTFAHFFSNVAGIDIHASKYTVRGTSKANKLRTFWQVEPDAVVGKVLLSLLDHWSQTSDPNPSGHALLAQGRAVANRLLAGGVNLNGLKDTATAIDAIQLSDQIRRMEQTMHTDPALAIGTAKELVETVCKTILTERGKGITGTPDMPTLTKEAFKELRLVPEGIPEEARGAKAIRVLLSNLGTIANNLAEIRNLYGTGHGPLGTAKGLGARHAKLAVGAAATLAMFLFETHKEAPP